MQEDKFDEHIKSSLQDQRAPYEASDWERLSDRLDQEQSSEDHWIDPIIQQKLGRHESLGSEDHWPLFEAQLKEHERHRERKIILRSLEATILMLIIFTIINFQKHTAKTEDDPQLLYAVDATNLVLPKSIHPEIGTTKSDIAAALYYVNDHQGKSLIEPPSLAQQPNNLGQPNVKPLLLSDDYDQTLNQSPTNLDHVSVSPVVGLEVIETSNDDLSRTQLGALEPLPSDIRYLYARLSLPETPAQLFHQHDFKVKGPKDGWSIGLSTSVEANFINNDLSFGYLQNQIRTGLSGNTYAVNFARRTGKLEFETGLQYSVKSFDPGQITSYEKSSSNTFLESQLNGMDIYLFQLPVLTKMHTASRKKSSFYMMAGMSFNLIYQNQYDIKRSIQSEDRYANTPLAKAFKLSDLPRGVRRGGTLQDNLYATVILGFGYDLDITSDLHLYLQPQYQNSLNSSINGVVDRINALSLETGMKWRF